MISNFDLHLREIKNIGQNILIENWDEKKKKFFSLTTATLRFFRLCDKIW